MRKFLCALGVAFVLVISGCQNYVENSEPEETQETTQKITLYPQEEAAIEVVETIKNQLKNPESIQIHSIYYSTMEWDKKVIQTIKTMDEGELLYRKIERYLDYDFAFEVDLSAENGFGGMNRTTYYMCYKNGYASPLQLDDANQFLLKKFFSFFGVGDTHIGPKIDLDRLGL